MENLLFILNFGKEFGMLKPSRWNSRFFLFFFKQTNKQTILLACPPLSTIPAKLSIASGRPHQLDVRTGC